MEARKDAQLLPGELTRIVESVFETMTNLEVGECATAWFPNRERLTSAIRMAGRWTGTVELECDRTQACNFAGRFLSMEPPPTVDEVVRDVMGELANMIGGNMKCVLSQGIQLSMPTVFDGSSTYDTAAATIVGERRAFGCAEGTFWIVVVSENGPGT